MSGERPERAQDPGMSFRQALQRLEPGRVILRSQVLLDPTFMESVRKDLSVAAGKDITLVSEVDPRFAAGAALFLGRDTRIDLDPRRSLLQVLQEQAAGQQAEDIPTLKEASRRLSDLVETTSPTPRLEGITGSGTVLQVGDGVAVVAGLRDVCSQELVRFESGMEGIAFDLLENSVGCLLLGPEQQIKEGAAVARTGRNMQVPVGSALIGRVVNALGSPIDGRGPVKCDSSRPVEALSLGVVERQPVSESLHSGIKVVDALVPLGRGQRELVLGDRKIGKTTLALDVILSQRGADVLCVYAAIGQKASSLARVLALLEERGAMDYTTVVAALASEAPAFRYLAPYAACTIAEEFMRQGRHALVVYDDLSKHAVTYREISALLQRPIGREAYPGDIFYVHSRLLERAARRRDDLGGGSLTAIPIVETLAGDISALIPTNVISICDGQIMLDNGLFNERSRPAMDAGLSVSRVGGMAQTAAMRRVAGRLRIDLAQYREMARFVRFGAEVDQATLAQLRRGERELEVLKQDAHVPLSLEHEVVLLHAAVRGHTDEIALDQLRLFEERLYDVMDHQHPEIMAAIRDTRDLSADTEARLDEALTAFRDAFLAEHAPAPAAG